MYEDWMNTKGAATAVDLEETARALGVSVEEVKGLDSSARPELRIAARILGDSTRGGECGVQTE